MTINRCFIVLVLIFSTAPCLGDTIYLKDGSVEKTDKVWEKDGYIHFILKGTKRVEIRYAKEIIERIEGAFFKPEANSLSLTAKKDNHDFNNRKQPAAVRADKKPSPKNLTQTEHQLKQLYGIGFYDPRRRVEYWTTTTAHHESLKEAIAALADQYHRPQAWIIANMGKINDLGVIHKNLIESIRKGNPPLPGNTATGTSNQTKSASPTASYTKSTHPRKTLPVQNSIHGPEEDAVHMKNIPFYNPRKTLKYWSDKETGHRTISEAINAIAQKYHRSPDWVEENMGRVNDLGKIHQNLRQNLAN